MNKQEASENVRYLDALNGFECCFCGKVFKTKDEAINHILKECEFVYE